MKALAYLFFLGAGVAFAVLVATKLSADALGVVVGALLGVVATVPVTVLLVWSLSRRQVSESRGERPQQAYPQVVVVGGGAERYLPQPAPPMPMGGGGSARQFEMVGDFEDEEANYGDHAG